jgi:PPP family 3-phenylpropionic acid transporter
VLHGATCSFYDDFFGVHVADAGFGPEVLGGALAVGVGVEVAVLAAGERLLARLGVGSLLVLGVGAGPIRWVVTAVSTSPLAIVAAQSLHGLTFASYWVAMVALFSERSPVGLRSAALGVLLGATFGVGRLAELVVAGVWLDRVGARALFLAFAGVSVFATWLALTVRGLDAGVESWAEE